MGHIKHIIEDGQRFGMLAVIRYKETNAHGDRIFECVCECGNTTTATVSDLVSGNKKSCGCLHGENHGHTNDRLYGVWQTMKARCNRPTSHKYNSYGGRGIRVCEEWQRSFTAFREWALENGYDYNAPYGKCTLDRINVDGNYEPSNCRWVDAKTQAQNKRPQVFDVTGIEVDYHGKHYKSLSALAREYGFHPARLDRRIHRMTIEEAMDEIMSSIRKDELRKHIVSLIESGYTRREAANECGVSFGAVQYAIRKYRHAS